MNTTKGLVRAAGRSPKNCCSFCFGLLTLLLVVVYFFSSVACVALVILALAYLQPNWVIERVERLEPKVLWRYACKEKIAAMTIDDAPLLNSPTALAGILDALRDNDVHATFMVMSGFNAESGGLDDAGRRRHMALLERAVAEGHELGNHTMFDEPSASLPDSRFTEAFEHCDELIAELSGGRASWEARPRRWMRPGSALWTPHILRESERLGYTPVLTNCFPFDPVPLSRFVNTAYLARRVQPGSVIVLHDRWWTPGTLATALPRIKEQGFRLVTLSQLHAAVGAAKPVTEVPVVIGMPPALPEDTTSGAQPCQGAAAAALVPV